MDDIPDFKKAIRDKVLNFLVFFPTKDLLCSIFAGTPLGDLLGCPLCPMGYYEVDEECFRIAGPQANQVRENSTSIFNSYSWDLKLLA